MSRTPALKLAVYNNAGTYQADIAATTRTAIKVVDEDNGLGGISVTVQPEDSTARALCVDGNLVHAQVLSDYEAGTYVTIARGIWKDDEVITSALKASDKRYTADAPGTLWELTQESLPGPVAPFSDRVRYDWTWPDLDRSGWSAAVQRSVVGDRTETPPDGLAGLPRNFPNPLAYWIAPNVASGSDPVGDWFGAYEHTSVAEETWVIYAAADDGIEVALNGEVGISSIDDTGSAAADTWYWKVRMPAGTHTIAIRVRNLDNGIANNCTMAAVAVSRTVLTVDGYDEEWIFTTSTSGWVADRPASPPAPKLGIILAELLPAGWTRDFTDDDDSASNAWPEAPIILDAWEDKWSALQQVVDGGWCQIAATDVRELSAWTTRGTDRPGTVFTDGQNLIRAEHKTDGKGVATGLRVRDRYGWFLVGSATGATPRISFPDESDRDEATRRATAKLAELLEPDTTISVQVWCDSAATTPGLGFTTGDTIRCDGPAGTVETYRVVSWTLELGADGRLLARLQLNTLGRDRVQRLARAMKRLTSGSLDGRSLGAGPVSPFQQKAGRLGERVWTWSWSGAASDVGTTVGPPAEFDRPYRLQRLVIECVDGLTGTTTVSGDLNGSSIATVSLTGATRNDSTFLSVAGPEDTFTVEMTAAGSHASGRIDLVGSPMP